MFRTTNVKYVTGDILRWGREYKRYWVIKIRLPRCLKFISQKAQFCLSMITAGQRLGGRKCRAILQRSKPKYQGVKKKLRSDPLVYAYVCTRQRSFNFKVCGPSGPCGQGPCGFALQVLRTLRKEETKRRGAYSGKACHNTIANLFMRTTEAPSSTITFSFFWPTLILVRNRLGVEMWGRKHT